VKDAAERGQEQRALLTILWTTCDGPPTDGHRSVDAPVNSRLPATRFRRISPSTGCGYLSRPAVSHMARRLARARPHTSAKNDPSTETNSTCRTTTRTPNWYSVSRVAKAVATTTEQDIGRSCRGTTRSHHGGAATVWRVDPCVRTEIRRLRAFAAGFRACISGSLARSG
jgi:hypothetical protein